MSQIAGQAFRQRDYTKAIARGLNAGLSDLTRGQTVLVLNNPGNLCHDEHDLDVALNGPLPPGRVSVATSCVPTEPRP